jgi:hypothetical protein
LKTFHTQTGFGALLLVAGAMSLAGCFGDDAEWANQTIADTARRDAYERCVAHGALQKYLDQCAAIGGTARIERRTYVCEMPDGLRNPQSLGAGPHCFCVDRNDAGECVGDADCSRGVEAKCAPLLEAEVQNFTSGDD